MMDVIRKRWAYFTARSNSRFEDRADPKVQLEQAISEAQDQHRRLVEQAANVVANQKQHELQLNRAMEELEKVNRSTRQALLMAQDAEKSGDLAKARELTQTAEAFANRLIASEKEVDGLKTLSLQTTQAADQAKAAVSQNSSALQQKLAERQKLMSQLDQAKMQEQLNTAMNNLSATVDQTAPSLDQVRAKIEARYAKAIGASELGGQTVEARMLEVEQMSMGTEARSRLDSMRAELGIGATGELASPAPSGGELGTGAPATAAPTEAETVATEDKPS